MPAPSIASTRRCSGCGVLEWLMRDHERRGLLENRTGTATRRIRRAPLTARALGLKPAAGAKGGRPYACREAKAGGRDARRGVCRPS